MTEDTSLREKALRATKGNWRRIAMGGSSTVVTSNTPRRNDTRIPGYGYHDDEYCLAYPFIEDDNRVRYDFVCFSHEDADWISATQPKAILALLDASEAKDRRIEALEVAMKPFAQLADELPLSKPSDRPAWGYNDQELTSGPFRDARAALSGKEGQS